jgi:hypothetical protein
MPVIIYGITLIQSGRVCFQDEDRIKDAGKPGTEE